MNIERRRECLNGLRKTIVPTPFTLAIDETLAKLGENAYEVAENLYAMGYQGRVKSPAHCPIARFLRDRFPTECVLARETSIRIRLLGSDKDSLIVPPLVVSIFISRFDHLLYPALVES